MEKKDWVIVGLNAALAVGLCALIGFGRISWDQFLVGLGLLVTPSAGGLFAGKQAKKVDDASQ